MGRYHARLSPSSAHRWTECSASVGAQEGKPNEGSDASRFGTCAHQIHEECLLDPDKDLQSYLGRTMWFWSHPESESRGEDWSDLFGPNSDPCMEVLHEVVVTQEMLDGVGKSLDYIQQQVDLLGGELFVEQAVPIGHITGEEDATGSADAIHKIAALRRLNVFDLKAGRHKVHAFEVLRPAGVDPITGESLPEQVRPNLQMALYALGALHKFCQPGEIDTVTMTIVQPLIGHISEYTISVDELTRWGAWLAEQADEVREHPVYRPSADACHFCRASGDCAAQSRTVAETALIGFDDVATARTAPVPEMRLGDAYALIPLVETWVKAVQGKVADALNAGQPVVRSDGLAYVLVEGRNASRSWTDEVQVAAHLDVLLHDHEMWKKTLISPAETEKLTKAKRAKKGEKPTRPRLPAEHWADLQQYVSQGTTAPAIALETDPRPRVVTAADGFSEVQDVNEDLF